MASLLSKLEEINNRFNAVSNEITKPEVISDRKKNIELNREYKNLSKIVEIYKEYKNLIEGVNEAENILKNEKDREMLDMAKQEVDILNERLPLMEEAIKTMLIPKDPADSKNAIIEIRGGSGGDEANIFAGDLFRMYTKYAERRGWKLELVDFNEGTSGGYKEIIFNLLGEDVYGDMKYEAGVHRVQRVPQTETMGRVHTSASTVVVMPEAEEFDIELNVNDVRKDLFCSSGPGGQSVNTTYSAVRLTHIPTGIVAQCQDEKSQIKNYEKALKVLRSRLYEIELQKRLDEEASKRKSMVSSGDRSAKIRTYNYPQGRVTDHRINLTIYNLTDFLNGDIDKIISELKMVDNTEKLLEGKI